MAFSSDQGPLISVLKRLRLTKNIDCSCGWFYSPYEGDYLMIPHFLLLKFVQSPIACKRCRNCDHEFKKRAESEPVAIVKKAPSKRGMCMIIVLDSNKPSNVENNTHNGNFCTSLAWPGP